MHSLAGSRLWVKAQDFGGLSNYRERRTEFLKWIAYIWLCNFAIFYATWPRQNDMYHYICWRKHNTRALGGFRARAALNVMNHICFTLDLYFGTARVLGGARAADRGAAEAACVLLPRGLRRACKLGARARRP